MRFQLIVFDWDGTLMDSEARIVACIRAAFVDIGEPPPPPEVARDVIGLGLDEAMTVLWPDGGTQERGALVERYRSHFLGINETASNLFPGIPAMLEALGDRGLRLAVATGKSRRGLELALASTGLKGCFQATRCADEARSKPHPEMLLWLMRELGVEPGATLMVGDTEYDMQMAGNAGVAAVAVCYGVHAPERLRRQAPLACLEDLRELPQWLDAHARPA